MAATGVAKTIKKLRVVNLPWTVGDLQLKQYFSQFGFIDEARVIFDRRTGMSRNQGVLEIADREICQKIISHSNHSLEGQNLYLRYHNEK